MVRVGWPLAVRGTIFLLLILSLCGIGWERKEAGVGVLVVRDESASVSVGGREVAAGFVESLDGELVRGLVFAGGPVGDALMRAAALRWDDRPTRLVLVTDGVGISAVDEVVARRLAAEGVPTDVVGLDRERDPEVEVDAVEVPRMVQPGQRFDVAVVVRANRAGMAGVRLYQDGLLVGERTEEMEVGENRAVFADVAGAGSELRVEVSAEGGDTFAENNVMGVRVAASRSARVLVLDPQPERMEWLAGTLRAAEFEVEVRPTNAAPERVEGLDRFDLVVLSDSGADELGDERMRALASWVSDLGGGLILSGGENGFAAGGYYDTPLAELSPVEIAYEDGAELPVAALMIALDRSGSMAATVSGGGQTKMALANEGVIRAMDALQAKDLFGVLAVDTEARPVVPLGRLTDRKLVAERVLGIQSGGGGIYVTTAMVALYRALREADARIKHVILFSDAADAEEKEAGGMASLDLAGAMLAQRITVSVVALGGDEDRDTEFLRVLAERGGGRFYLTSDALSLPRIFAEESLRATRTNLVEDALQPVVVGVGDEIGGIDWGTAPFLLGYNATSAKDGARTLLATERGDPLLATARLGLGTVAAFTSDLKGRWTGDWLGWPGFQKLVTQLARAVARGADADGVVARVEAAGGGVRVVVEASDAGGGFVDGAEVEVTRLADGRVERAEQAGPGRYAVEFPEVGAGGGFSVRVGDRGAVVAMAGVGVGADGGGEFAVLGDVEPGIARLAAAGKGMVDPESAEVFRSTGAAVVTRRDLSVWFLVAALLLVPVDVWARRRGG